MSASHSSASVSWHSSEDDAQYGAAYASEMSGSSSVGTSPSSANSAPSIIALDAIAQPVRDQLYFYETPTHVYVLVSDRTRAVYDTLTFIKHTPGDVQIDGDDEDADEGEDDGADGDAAVGATSRSTRQKGAAGTARDWFSAGGGDGQERDAAAPQPWPRCARLRPHASVLSSTEAQSFVASLRRAHESPTVRLPLRWGRAKALVGAVRFTAGYYLLLVTKRRLVARIGSHRIFEVAETEMISLLQTSTKVAAAAKSTAATSAPGSSAASDPEKRSGAQYLASLASAAIPGLFRRSTEEEAYKKQFMDIGFHRHAFYYSHTYDLTNTLQTNMTVPAARRERRLKFVWNEFLHEPFADLWTDSDSDEEEEEEEEEEEGNTTAGVAATRRGAATSAASEHYRHRELDPFNKDPFEEEEKEEEKEQDMEKEEEIACDTATSGRCRFRDRRSPRRPAFAGPDALPVPDYFQPHTWQLFFTHGAVVQKVIWLQHRSILLTLIGRVSREYTGARYLRRGINSDGHVANHVEVEQIVCDESTLMDHHTTGAFSAYVQVRGSIPLHWSHAPSALPKPPILLAPSIDPAYHDTCLHFQELIADYGVPVVCMDFVKQQEKRPREVPLGSAFKHAVESLAASARCGQDDSEGQTKTTQRGWPHLTGGGRGGDILQYHAMDLRRVADRAWNAVTAVAERTSEDVGFFACVPPANERVVTAAAPRGARLVRLQHGVVRSNCIDCIDRTNVGQYFFSLHALGQQLAALNLLYAAPDLCLSPSVQELLLQMYLFLGDAIAMQYGGSAQVGAGVLHRGTGWDQWMGIQRLYHNVLGDREKQAVVNLFLGRFQPAPLFWWRPSPGVVAPPLRLSGRHQATFTSPLFQQRTQAPAGAAMLRESEDAAVTAAHTTMPRHALQPRFVSRALNPEMTILPSALMRGARLAAGHDGRSCPQILLPLLMPDVMAAAAARWKKRGSGGGGGMASDARHHASHRHRRTTRASGESVAKLLDAAYGEAGADYYLVCREEPRLERGALPGTEEGAPWWSAPLMWHLCERRCDVARSGDASSHNVCGKKGCYSCHFLHASDGNGGDEDDEDDATHAAHYVVDEHVPDPRLPPEHAVATANTSLLGDDTAAFPLPTRAAREALRRAEAQQIDIAAHERRLCIEPPLDDLGAQVMTGGGNKATLEEVMDDGFQLELGTAIITAHAVADHAASQSGGGGMSSKPKASRGFAEAFMGRRDVPDAGLDVVRLVGTTSATSPCAQYHTCGSVVSLCVPSSRGHRPQSFSSSSCWSRCQWSGGPASTGGADDVSMQRYCPQFTDLPKEVRDSVYSTEISARLAWRPSFGVSLGTCEAVNDVVRFDGAEQDDAYSTILSLANTLSSQYGAVPSPWSVAHVRGAVRASLEMTGARPLSPLQWTTFGAEVHDGSWLVQLSERYEERCDRGYWASFFATRNSKSSTNPSIAADGRGGRSRSPSRFSSVAMRAGSYDDSNDDYVVHRQNRAASRRLSDAFLQRWFACLVPAQANSQSNLPSAPQARTTLDESLHDALQLLLRVTRYLVHVANGTGVATSMTRVPSSKDGRDGRSPLTQCPRSTILSAVAETVARLLGLRGGTVDAQNVQGYVARMVSLMRTARDAVAEMPRLRFSDEPLGGTGLHERVLASFILPPSFLRSQLVDWWTRPRLLAGGTRVQLSREAAARLVEWLMAEHIVLPLFAPRAGSVSGSDAGPVAAASSSSLPASVDAKVYTEEPTALFCFAASVPTIVLNRTARAADSHPDAANTRKQKRDTMSATTVADHGTCTANLREREHVRAAALAESLASVAESVLQALQHTLADNRTRHGRAASPNNSSNGNNSNSNTSRAAGSSATTETDSSVARTELTETLTHFSSRLAELSAGLHGIDLARAIQDLQQDVTWESVSTHTTTTTTTATKASSTVPSTALPVPLPNRLTRRDRFLLCFFTNVFNALYVHAWMQALCEQLAPSSSSSSLHTTPALPSLSSRLSVAFYESYAYQIGAHEVFSLSDIKYGILQGNCVRPYSCSPPLHETGDDASSSGVSHPDPRLRYVPECLVAVQPLSQLTDTADDDGDVRLDGLIAAAASEDEIACWSAALACDAFCHAHAVDASPTQCASRAAQCALWMRRGWRLQQRDAQYIPQRVGLGLLDTYLAAPFLDEAVFVRSPAWSTTTVAALSPTSTSQSASPVQRQPPSAASSPALSLLSPVRNALASASLAFPAAASPSSMASFAVPAAAATTTTSPAPPATTTSTTSAAAVGVTSPSGAGVDLWPAVLAASTSQTAAVLAEAASALKALTITMTHRLPVLLEATVEAQLCQLEQSAMQHVLSVRHWRTPAQMKALPHTVSGGEEARQLFLVRLAAAYPGVFSRAESDAVGLTVAQDVLGALQAGQQSSRALTRWKEEMRQRHDGF